MAGKSAGIIIVGDEILKGHVKDTNSHFMCTRLRAIGTKVTKISVVEDNLADIAEVVREFSQKFDLVLTSGGIGPTHDDVTYRGIAEGFNEEIVSSDALQEFFKKQSFSKSEESYEAMSLIPKSSQVIWAKTEKLASSGDLYPLVRVHNLFVFPGIPEYLEELFTVVEKEYFQSQGCSFYTGKIYLSTLEDVLLNALNKSVEEFKDCVFGSYPVLGNAKYKTLITVEAVSVDKVRAAEEFFKALISPHWLVAWPGDMSSPVYKLLHTTADPNMGNTLRHSIQVVEKAFDDHPTSGLMVSFNGGKDCTVLLHIALAVKERKGVSEPLQAVYFRPTNPFAEVEQFIDDTVSRYGIELTILPGSIKSALAVLVQEKPDVQAIFLGTRRTDPFSQNLNEFQITDPGWPQVMRVNPILDWSYQDVWMFLRGINAPYCPLYDQGYTSLGNQDNTRPNPCLLQTGEDGVQRYDPAWMLTDDSEERNGRFSAGSIC